MWTNEQKQAIEAPNTGLIVSAAAGSGKTAVLVERLCRQICDNIPVQKMIVVTFTDDAAAQMKSRLSDVLRRKIALEPQNEWLQRQQNMLGSAKISTISSFCFNLIRENINLLDISPNFRIIDSVEEKVLLLKGANEALERYYAENPDNIAELDNYFCKNSDAKIIDFLIDLHHFTRSIPFWEDYLEGTLRKIRKAGEDPEWIADDYCGYIKSEIKDLIAEFEGILELCTDEFAAYAVVFEEIIYALNSFLAKINAQNIFEAAQEINSISLKSMPPIRQLAPELIPKKTMIQNLKAKASKQLSAIQSECLTREEMRMDYVMHFGLLSKLFDLFYKFEDRFEAIKREKKALTFSDGEQLALKILSDKSSSDKKSDVARALSEYYEIIACDEYQDVNDVEEMIFTLISKNRTNIFAVGDIKQSIYRFRQANPEIFLKTVNSSQNYKGGKSDIMQKIVLAKNFRSSKQTVDFINFVFSQLMTEECGDVDYNSGEELIYGANYDADDRKAEILLVESDDETNTDISLCEADAVALRIKDMLDSKASVTLSDGSKRQCTARDFCILMNTRKRFSEFKGALEKLGIKASTITKSGYLNSREIMILKDILRVIDNPTADISLAAVALSPVFSFDADELSALRLVDPSASLYSSLYSAVKDGLFAEPMYSKCASLLSCIENLRLYSAGCGICDLIQKIYITTDLLSIMQIWGDGEKKAANLRLMLSYAQSYENASAGGLSGFLRYLDSIEQKKGDLSVAQTVSGSDDAVTITTIHSSKGLEYPFVFICDLRRKFNLNDSKKSILMHKSFGMGVKYYNKVSLKSYETFEHVKIAKRIRDESASESLRLLYVAMTRAKERLFMTLMDDDELEKKLNLSAIAIKSNAQSRFIKSALSFEDWLVLAILGDKSAEKLAERCEIPIAAKTHTDFSVTSICPEKEFYRNADFSKHGRCDERLKSRLIDAFNRSEQESSSQKQAKLTATELGEHGDIELKVPEFACDTLLAAQRGTAVHKFMQHCDFKSAESSLKAEAERLKAHGILSEKEFEAISFEKIGSFFSSEIFERIGKSDFVRREMEYLVSMKDISPHNPLWGSVLPSEYIGADTMLQGVIDCIFSDSGGLILLDYKTDRASCKQIALRYENQLKIYAACAEIIFGKKVLNAYIWSFDNNCLIEINI